MKKALGILIWLYIAFLLFICVVVASGCEVVREINGDMGDREDVERDSITVIWEADANMVMVQCYDEGWITQCSGGGIDSVVVVQQGHMYRLVAVGGVDTTYSRVVWVR